MIEPSLDDIPFVITLRARPAPIPAAIRVRHLLKFALRSLDLRCVDIRPAIEPTDKPNTVN
jgi:hypothetical protein